MAASISLGQTALLPLPPRTSRPPRMTDTVIAPSLEVERSEIKDKGMLVYKVGKTGKLQPRRLGVSDDHRTLWVTSGKVGSVRQGLMALVGSGSNNDSGPPNHLQGIDVSRMDHVIQGQVTKRFSLAKEVQGSDHSSSGGLDLAGGIESAERLSLTLCYRQTKKQLGLGTNSSQKVEDGKPLETLDLIVPNGQHFMDLLNAIQDLLVIYKKQMANSDRTTLLLEYFWVDMGKETKDLLSQNEWLDLCDRMNVPLRKAHLASLYKAVSKLLRKEDMDLQKLQKTKDARRKAGKKFDDDASVSSRLSLSGNGLGGKGGLPLWAVVELMNDVRFHSMEAAGLKLVDQDPMLRLWFELLQTDPVPGVNSQENQKGLMNSKSGKPQDQPQALQSVSSVALLSFIRSQQKEFRTTLEDTSKMIQVLNGQQSGDAKFEESKDDRLSKDRFFQYLLSDANDLMDPDKGKPGADDMTHPLSHYWICSSHDTFLNSWSHTANEAKGLPPLHDEQMYLMALYRGVRALELDVWDRRDEPVIAKEEPTTLKEPYLPLRSVLQIVKKFLLANPKCFPVILNIENHCNFENQERLAKMLFSVLGKAGLIVVPDDTASIDEADLLPSPHSMRGKVVIMGKRPKVIEDGAKIINDDFDDENDEIQPDDIPTTESRDIEEAQLDQGVVIGFDAAGPIKAKSRHEKNLVQHTAGELLYMAKQDFEQAKIRAVETEMKAMRLQDEAEKAESYSLAEIKRAGLTQDAVVDLAMQVKGPEIDPKEHVTLLAPRMEGEGVEVQEFFGDGVAATRTAYAEMEQKAIEAASVATTALQRLNIVTAKLRDAEQALENSYKKEREQVSSYQRAASDARSMREDAEYAKKRVEKLKEILSKCEDSATSAENVVVTATTEAKISEKRASETEARAARASSKAQEDRKRADEETRKEEELEREAAALHEKLADASARVKEARRAMDKAAAMIDRVNEQVKLIEQSSQYVREVNEQSNGIAEEKKDSSVGKGGKLMAKRAAKIEERRQLSGAIQKASADLKEFDEKRRRIQDAFEDKARKWKNQSEIASKVRKIADRSAHAAEELAEHAEEEREAANLRHVAQKKAKSSVSEKDSYRASVKAQLKEAQRVSKEAETKAAQARSMADSLEHVNNDLPTHEAGARRVEEKKEDRDAAFRDYEEKRKLKEEADENAAEAKRLYETSENLYAQAMHSAAQEDQRVDVQREADRVAIVAFNQARLARKQAEHAMEDVQYAQSVVAEKQAIVKRANEYGEKMARITTIPTSLAKMTFLHTTKHRHWDKSFDLPNTHVHSFAQGVLDIMKERDPQNPERLKEFTTEHLCRTFPSWKDLKGHKDVNSDPLFLWALGCQLVSLNYSTFDEHVLKADGRFRRNGSSGYVLKPEKLTHDDPLRESAETWNINLLCGSCLPAPESTRKSFINPFVRITVYGGDIEGKSTQHSTGVVMKNGINPIWDEKDGIAFTARYPSLAICAFTVWHKGDNGDEFIGASAMPVSCMREGIRSVPIFDKFGSRSGPYAYCSLLVSATKSAA